MPLKKCSSIVYGCKTSIVLEFNISVVLFDDDNNNKLLSIEVPIKGQIIKKKEVFKKYMHNDDDDDDDDDVDGSSEILYATFLYISCGPYNIIFSR